MAADNDASSAAGRSIIVREGDLCRWVFIGDISGDELRRLLAIQTSLLEGRDYYLQIIDMSRIGNVTSEARKVGAEAVDLRARGTAIYGSSFHVRMVANLVSTASALLRKAKQDDAPVRFFETEKESMAWIEERRAHVLKGRR